MKRNIAIFTERLKTGFGVDLVVFEQARRLAKHYSVHIFAIDIDKSFLQKRSNLIVHPLYIHRCFNPLKADYFAVKYLFKTRHIVNLFDAVILQSPPFYSWLPFLRHKNTIAYDHGNSPSSGYPFPTSLRQAILECTQRYLYFPFAKKIITISNFLDQRLPQNLSQKTTIIAHGTEHITRLRVSPKAVEKFRKDRYLSESDLIATYIGRLDYRLNPYKNTRVLVETFSKLRGRFKNLRLFMIGFPQGDIVAKLKKRGIDVLPNACNREVKLVLLHSKVYVTTSLWEGFNLPLIEAQVLGVPVVALDRGAHPEVVQDGVTGYLAKNTKEFSDKIKTLITNGPLRLEMSKQAKIFAKNFSWDKNVERLIKVIES